MEPTEQLRLAAGVYNADPKVGEDDQNGVDFVLNPEDGVLVFAEAGYRNSQEDGDTGLPGEVTFGGYYDSSEFESFSDPGDERKGNYGLYALLDQMAYREGGAGSEQGLTPWVALTFAPIKGVNTLPFFAAGGLVYQGLFRGRDEDTTNLGVYYGNFSDDLGTRASRPCSRSTTAFSWRRGSTSRPTSSTSSGRTAATTSPTPRCLAPRSGSTSSANYTCEGGQTDKRIIVRKLAEGKGLRVA